MVSDHNITAHKLVTGGSKPSTYNENDEKRKNTKPDLRNLENYAIWYGKDNNDAHLNVAVVVPENKYLFH